MSARNGSSSGWLHWNSVSRLGVSLAEREGLPRRSSKINKISHLTVARLVRVYQCCALKSRPYGPIALSHLDDQKLPQRCPSLQLLDDLVILHCTLKS